MTTTARTRIAADIGGTFTDVTAFDEKRGVLLLGKTLTTPQRLITGITDGMKKAGVTLDEANLFLHGSTIAINTMLERKGAKTALITTDGFRDVYEIGRINRPDAYNLFFQKHQPLIERALCFEVKERVRADGEVLIPLDEEGLIALGDKIAALGIRLRRWVTFHGLSINVEPDLDHFSGIVPCGIAEAHYGVTSLVDLGLPVTMDDADHALRKSFEKIFGSTITI